MALLFPALVIVACTPLEDRRSHPSADPAPAVVHAPPEISTIAIPIRASLAPVAAMVDQQVARRFDGKAQERGIDVRYEVARDPIRLEMIGSGLHTSTSIKYALEACRGRFPCISCGFGEARRIADIRFQTKLDWDPSWRIRSHTHVLPVHYARPCTVTWFDFDITRRWVAPVIEEQLRSVAATIDRNIPKQTVIRPSAEQIWTAMQTPAELAPRTWLALEPLDLALTPIGGSGTTVSSTLVLRANTRVIVGDKPAATRKPLPPLKTVPAAPAAGLRVPFDVELPYAEASRLATRDYANRTYRVNGRPLAIESIRINPAPRGRVLVEASIDYRGGALRNYKGPIYLEGTPRFDPASAAIAVPDLDYSLDPTRRGFFARIAERAAHDSIRQRLRESARFDLTARLNEVRAEITRALNRSLAPGVTLRGHADAIGPSLVTAREDAIVVRVIATGAAEVSLSR